jgi:hypothetical protein
MEETGIQRLAGAVAGALRQCLREIMTTPDFRSGRKTFSQERDGVGVPAIEAKLDGVIPRIPRNVIDQQLASPPSIQASRRSLALAEPCSPAC